MVSLLLFFAVGCEDSKSGDTADTADTADTTDTADTADSGDTATSDCAEPGDTAPEREAIDVSFADSDDTCDRSWAERDIVGWNSGGGCGWGYVWLRTDNEALALHLELPAADQLEDHDWVYSFAPGHGAELQLALGTGTDDFDFWSCSDYTEGLQGVTVWTAVAGRIEVEARWVCDTVDPFCGDDETEHHAVVRLVGIELENGAGECEELDDVELKVGLGGSECGG